MPRLPSSDTVLAPLRAGMAWINTSQDLVGLVRTARGALPGDPDFGDPYSTAGNEPAQLVGRRLWAINHRRWTAAGETGLAFLQVAEWVTRREQARDETRDVVIVFTDLVGFSSWALEAGDDSALELLRRVGAVVEGCVEQYGGRLIKRLGDGIMAVFEEPTAALNALDDAIDQVAQLDANGYEPRLRAGLHVGHARRLGGDYLGVDVNIASRICEEADGGEVLVSGPARARLDDDGFAFGDRRAVSRPGVPSDLEVHVASLNGRAA